MLIVMKHDASEADDARVASMIRMLGYEAALIPGAQRSAIGVTGNDSKVDGVRFKSLIDRG